MKTLYKLTAEEYSMLFPKIDALFGTLMNVVEDDVQENYVAYFVDDIESPSVVLCLAKKLHYVTSDNFIFIEGLVNSCQRGYIDWKIIAQTLKQEGDNIQTCIKYNKKWGKVLPILEKRGLIKNLHIDKEEYASFEVT